MEAEAVVSVSAAVVALTMLVKWAGLRDSWGPAAIMALSVIGVILWAYSKGPAYERTQLFDYFVGWIAVATGAAGVFGFTRSLPASVVTGNPTSEIPGAGQNPTAKPHMTERRQ